MTPATIPPNPYITWDDAVRIVKILGPFVAIIIGLLIWAWHVMEKNIEANSIALNEHLDKDDEIHDRLFTDHRNLESKVDRLHGEHDARRKSGEC